jgi:Xaa-Pro dipeptidase
MYWLTGYDTFGYVFFQCLYLGANGDLKLLTRMPDLRQAKFTSIIPDIRIWKDAEHANPAHDLMHMLDESGCRGKRLGVEWESYGLTARNGRLLDETLKEFCRLQDASFLISRLRLTKSPQEFQYVRKAEELADLALDEIHRTTAPGAFEGDILAALQAVIFRNDGDYPGNENIIGSGPGAFLGRYFTGRRRLGQDDELLVEFAGVYRRYHAALMRVIRVGKPSSTSSGSIACKRAKRRPRLAARSATSIRPSNARCATPATSSAASATSAGRSRSATASARPLRPTGWITRCFIVTTRWRSRRTWCSSCT